MDKKLTECKTCGFPKEWERDIIILDNNVISLMQVVDDDKYRCPECRCYKDGSTIKKLKPLLLKYKQIGIYKAIGLCQSKFDMKQECLHLEDFEKIKKELKQEGEK